MFLSIYQANVLFLGTKMDKLVQKQTFRDPLPCSFS